MIDRMRLVELLEELGALLELDGANSFRVGAHTKAADSLARFEGNLDESLAADRLQEIPSVGAGMAAKIREFADSGTIAELDELRTKFPPGMLEMMQIPGFGAKKLQAVHRELGIGSVDELKLACEDGRVAGLKGFGAKTAAKILSGIEQLRRFAGQYRIDDAMEAAQPLLERLRAHPAVLRAEVAGSLRRRKEIVKDIDFVCATTDPVAVMAAFVSQPEAREILGHGETKSSVRLRTGMQADLRAVAPEQFAYALCHFTGSKEHNTKLRSRAKTLGLKLNEYGLHPDAGGPPLPAETEEDIHRHLGLDYMTPELREDRGEVEAAEVHALPPLLELSDLRGLMHMHTHYSDGKPELRDYAEWALARNFSWMGIADHSKALAVARGLSEERVLQQHAEIDALNAEYAPKGVRLLKGIEADILLDGSMDYSGEFRDNFQFIVASVHSFFNLTEAEQTARILHALEDPSVTILGHMTGRLLLQRDGYPCDQQAIIRAAAQAGVAIEINANPRRLDLDWRLVKFALDQGCWLSIGPDAHVIAGLDDTWFGVQMARKGWATRDHVLNCLSADEFLAFAAARRK